MGVERTLCALENAPVADKVFRLVLRGDASDVLRPGRFVNLSLPGFFLRRPISICDWDDETLILLYKVIGGGTDALSRLSVGDTVSALMPLGNGFDPSMGERPLLAGGGVGAPPLFGLAKALLRRGAKPRVALGFASKKDAVLTEEFAALGVPVRVATVDGTLGERGFVTDLFDKADFDSAYACGPEPMLRAVYDRADVPGQFSFEARMACGFGACVGCARRMRDGVKRVCADGPVFGREEILWQTRA